MRILGIDADTHDVGMCLLSDKPEFFHLVVSGEDFNQRLADVAGFVDTVDWQLIDGVSIERPYFNHNVKTFGELSQLHGAIKVTFLRRGIKVWEPSYSETLTVVSIPTTLGRAEIKKEVLRLVNLEYECKSIHEADSYLAARYMKSRVEVIGEKRS